MLMIFKNIFPILLGLLLFPKQPFAQLKAYQFEQIDSLQKIEKREVIIFIHTDWCKYCQSMKHTTFKNKGLVNLLNNDFYFVSFNAEINQHIQFNGKSFHFKPTGTNTGVHELAEELGNVDGNLSYPALCILDADFEIVFQYNAFLTVDNLTEILQKVK